MKGVSARAIIVGLVMVVVIVGMTQVLSIQQDAVEVGGNAPPPAPIYLLFLYVLLAAPLLRWSAKLSLSRADLLVIYCMMLVAGPITHPYAIGFLLPHTVSPLYLKATEPSWGFFQSSLPRWIGPSGSRAINGFYYGTRGVVPWSAWWAPMAAWCSLLVALFFVMLCVNVLISRQWIERERLAFPLAAIPLNLTSGVGMRLSGLLSQRIFWVGFALALLLDLPGTIHRYLPVVPGLPIHHVPLLEDASNLPHPWNGLGPIEFDLIFWLVGVVYLVPKELAFSGWFFYLVARLEDIFAVWHGTTGEAPSVYSNDFPALFAQGAGAALALTAITIYSARSHLMGAFRRAMGDRRAPDDSSEFLSFRTAVLGILLGMGFVLGWCVLAGMRLWVAGLLFGLMFSYFFVFTRIRAETGLGMGVILWPKMLDEMMLTIVGARNMTLHDLTILHALRWLYFGSATGAVMACQLEGFKIADAGGLKGRSVGWVLALAATVTVPLAFAWGLHSYYQYGFAYMRIGDRNADMVGSQVYWSYQNLVYAHDSPTGTQWGGLLALSAGAAITIALSVLRMRFLWFPLHPVGYLAANSWGMQINWASFLVGWLIKVLVTRYGGLGVYRRLLPFFVGLIVGDMVHEGIAGLAAWLAGSSPA